MRNADMRPRQNTERRSTLRIQRESELLGSALSSYHSRENVVLGAKFLRDDLPYFVELLAEVTSMTSYKRASMIYVLLNAHTNAMQPTPSTRRSTRSWNCQ